MTTEEAIQALPSRARVGLALASVEHVVATLSTEPVAFSEARQGLDDGWRWVHGGKVDPIKFYERVEPLALASTDFPIGTAKKNALLSAVAAFCYTTGEILSYGASAGIDPEDTTLDSEMADIGEDDLVDCLQKAVEGAPDVTAEAQWQRHLADRLVADFRTDDPDQLGPTIAREYFLS